jgi:hypothetical protein
MLAQNLCNPENLERWQSLVCRKLGKVQYRSESTVVSSLCRMHGAHKVMSGSVVVECTVLRNLGRKHSVQKARQNARRLESTVVESKVSRKLGRMHGA